MFLQPPLIFAWVFILAIFKTFHHFKLKICRLSNTIFENIPKFQRHYYHDNSKHGKKTLFDSTHVCSVFIVVVLRVYYIENFYFADKMFI